MNCTGKRCIMQYDKVDPATCKCVSYCPQATPPKMNDVLKETRSIPSYDELLKVARAMHTWIFLHSGDEELAYKACGLSDEMNAFLGYSGSLTFTVPEDEEE